MIHLITGLPGSGKTLYTLEYVQAQFKGREIYYSGIPELKLPWVELVKPEEWHKLPNGCVVVIDECQRYFRPRGNGAVVPESIQKMETHRHGGIDLVLISQHPMLIDQNVRRLAGRHFHVVRAFGMQGATVHEWGQVKEQCDKSRADSVKHVFKYPARTFALYKSAEVHTHKRRVPMRVFVLACVPLLLVALVLVFNAWREKSNARVKGHEAPREAVSSTVAAAPGLRGEKGAKSYVQQRQEYFESYTPFVPALPHTAPRYAEVTAPKDAPVPAACIESRSKGCRCYTQQATLMASVTSDLCRQIVAHGYFVDWKAPAVAGGQVASALASPQAQAVSTGAVVLPPASQAVAANAPSDSGAAGAARGAQRPSADDPPNRSRPVAASSKWRYEGMVGR